MHCLCEGSIRTYFEDVDGNVLVRYVLQAKGYAHSGREVRREEESRRGEDRTRYEGERCALE